MEFVRFIFSSVWIWLGFFAILVIILSGISSIIKAVKHDKKISVFHDKDGGQSAVIENATMADVQWVVEHVKDAKAIVKGDTND